MTGLRIGTLLVLAFCVGCGESKTDVSGKVTFNGKPVAWGNVTLPAKDNMTYYGELSTDGSFKVESVPSGPVKIGVTSMKPTVAPPKETGIKNAAMNDMRRPDRTKLATEEQAKAWFAIPDKYYDPATSGLSDTVGSGKPLNVDLK